MRWQKSTRSLNGPPCLSRVDDVLDRALSDAFHRAQAVAHGHRLRFAVRRIERVEHVARGVHVGRQDGHAARFRFAEEVDDFFRVVHVRRQHGGHEFGGVVRLQPRGLVRNQRVRGRVRLVETVAGEFLHRVEHGVGLAFVDAVLRCAFAEHDALLGHLGRILLAHRATQKVRAAERISADDLRHLHHLFLIHHDAVGFGEHGFDARIGIIDLFFAVLAFAIARDQVHRAGTEQRAERDEVFEAIGLRFLQHALHAARFELEHGDRLRAFEQFVDAFVVERELRDVERRFAGFGAACVDRLHRPVDDRERAQAEEVELDQADGFDVVLVELRDHAVAAAFANTAARNRSAHSAR